MSPRATTPSTTQPGATRRAVLAPSTFSAGIRLLPRDLQADARQLYHLLRTIDDLVDEEDTQAEQRVEAIEHWARRQDADTPETRILTDLSRRYPLPRRRCSNSAKGCATTSHTPRSKTKRTWNATASTSAARSAVVLAKMFGTSHPDGENKMATLGRAFQRTNILRDIDEDLAHGRLYIARTTIERFGPPSPGAREELLRDQIARADRLYDEGLDAIPLLTRGQRGMALAAALYREILRQIEQAGYGRTAGRVTVPAGRIRLTDRQAPPHALPRPVVAPSAIAFPDRAVARRPVSDHADRLISAR